MFVPDILGLGRTQSRASAQGGEGERLSMLERRGQRRSPRRSCPAQSSAARRSWRSTARSSSVDWIQSASRGQLRSRASWATSTMGASPASSGYKGTDLCRVFRKVKKDHPFKIDAIVVLPDHLYCIWTLPDGDSNYKTRWALIKAGFSRKIPTMERRSKSRNNRGERGIWQRRFWEHMIRDERDFCRHADYAHWNPVKP
jgi:REP element-mobilizing transposase RayT